MKKEIGDRRIMNQTRTSDDFYLPDICVKSTNIGLLLHIYLWAPFKKDSSASFTPQASIVVRRPWSLLINSRLLAIWIYLSSLCAIFSFRLYAQVCILIQAWGIVLNRKKSRIHDLLIVMSQMIISILFVNLDRIGFFIR